MRQLPAAPCESSTLKATTGMPASIAAQMFSSRASSSWMMVAMASTLLAMAVSIRLFCVTRSSLPYWMSRLTPHSSAASCAPFTTGTKNSTDALLYMTIVMLKVSSWADAVDTAKVMTNESTINILTSFFTGLLLSKIKKGWRDAGAYSVCAGWPPFACGYSPKRSIRSLSRVR